MTCITSVSHSHSHSIKVITYKHRASNKIEKTLVPTLNPVRAAFLSSWWEWRPWLTQLGWSLLPEWFMYSRDARWSLSFSLLAELFIGNKLQVLPSSKVISQLTVLCGIRKKKNHILKAIVWHGNRLLPVVKTSVYKSELSSLWSAETVCGLALFSPCESLCVSSWRRDVLTVEGSTGRWPPHLLQ